MFRGISVLNDLIAALESLPAHYLEIILLRDFEEVIIGEIGPANGYLRACTAAHR